MIHDKYDEDDDDDKNDDDVNENKALTQDNPKHGESASQTECCGESALYCIFNVASHHI